MIHCVCRISEHLKNRVSEIAGISGVSEIAGIRGVMELTSSS